MVRNLAWGWIEPWNEHVQLYLHYMDFHLFTFVMAIRCLKNECRFSWNFSGLNFLATAYSAFVGRLEHISWGEGIGSEGYSWNFTKKL